MIPELVAVQVYISHTSRFNHDCQSVVITRAVHFYDKYNIDQTLMSSLRNSYDDDLVELFLGGSCTTIGP